VAFFGCVTQRHDFSVRAAGALGVALAQDFAVNCNQDTTTFGLGLVVSGAVLAKSSARDSQLGFMPNG
jgi:hypothetical protein